MSRISGLSLFEFVLTVSSYFGRGLFTNVGHPPRTSASAR